MRGKFHVERKMFPKIKKYCFWRKIYGTIPMQVYMVEKAERPYVS